MHIDGEFVIEGSTEFEKILKRNDPYVRFYPINESLLPCEETGVRSITVGTPPDYELESSNMFQIDLSGHASFDGILDYVSQVSPRKVIVDNSKRTRRLNAEILAANKEKILDRHKFSTIKKSTSVKLLRDQQLFNDCNNSFKGLLNFCSEPTIPWC